MQVEETPQLLILRAQVSLQERALPEAEGSIQAAMAKALLLWWGLPTPGAAMQVRSSFFIIDHLQKHCYFNSSVSRDLGGLEAEGLAGLWHVRDDAWQACGLPKGDSMQVYGTALLLLKAALKLLKLDSIARPPQ